MMITMTMMMMVTVTVAVMLVTEDDHGTRWRMRSGQDTGDVTKSAKKLSVRILLGKVTAR